MKQHNASRGANCRNPVRQRHGALLAMYEAKATKQLSSAIVIASSRFALLSLGASSLSKTPAAAAVDHAAAALTPTERQGRVCGIVCREHSDCHRQRRPSRHRPSRASTHRAKHTRQCKYILAEHCATTYVCGCLLEKQKKKKKRITGRHIRTARGTAGWQRYMRCGPNLNNHARWQHIHPQKQKKMKILKTRRQSVAVCVWRCGCLPALAAIKAKQEGKKCVLRPTGPRRTPTRHGSRSAPFVAAPPHACSRRGAQGRRHKRVGGCASGAVGREKHGTPHRKSAEETIKRGKSKKEMKRPQ
ncbi:hypothetical protein ECC02_013779 [Trypanosoma cruzi]|uniref:Uncharacterized protein n=1 Tax=Trypanosoma cruzi TaxID=5693 RepID=A0A7J6XG87_TRYCR|nr:hypothetical protein ECC02_013779 [Trypanosoma cruzi]